MGQRASALVAEDVGQLLKPDLDGFGGVDVLGQVRRFAPDGLREGKIVAVSTHDSAIWTRQTVKQAPEKSKGEDKLTNKPAYSFSKR